MVTSKCEHCGKEKEYKFKSHVKRFCSYTCARYGDNREKKPRVKLKCSLCNKEFELLESTKRAREKYNNSKIKYCSSECSAKDRIKAEYVSCLNCGKSFRTTRQKYCSVKCSNECPERREKRKKKGYWYENGYKVIYTENGKGIKEHIKVMEEHIQRKLKENEVVHHINEIKTDNRLENLQLMTKSEHSSHHRKLEISRGKKMFLSNPQD